MSDDAQDMGLTPSGGNLSERFGELSWEDPGYRRGKKKQVAE